MLNLDGLSRRLYEWSSRFKTAHPRLEAAPISLYQELFALVHDLKSSVQLTEDPQIRGLQDTVANAESALRRLAYDEVELDTAKNKGLYALACELTVLEALEVYLGAAIASAKALPALKLELLSKPFPWDALSRARAQSCYRRGYSFFSLTSDVILSALGEFERSVREMLLPLGGVDVVRQLAPRTQPGTADLKLDVLQVVAFPGNAAANARQATPALTQL